MKILWIAPRWPEPANDGAKIASFELLKNLLREPGFEMSFLGLIPEGEPTPEFRELALFKEVVRVSRSASRLERAWGWVLRPWIPLTFIPFAKRRLRKQVLDLARRDWDWIVLDGLHAALPLIDLTPGGPRWMFETRARVAYRAHNVESLLWKRTADQSGFLKASVIRAQSERVRRTEKEILRKVSVTFPVSSEDQDRLREIAPQAKFQLVRIGQTFSESASRRRANADSTVLGFIGRLDWLPNREGLEWFLKTVWPDVIQKNPKLRLKIAGIGDARWLESFQSLSGVEILGKIEQVESFYASIDLSIVPVFFGSGTRVKAIEAARYSVPCLSTSVGMEGSTLEPQKEFLLAEDRQSWIREILKATPTDCGKMGDRAFSKMKQTFDSAAIAAELARTLTGESPC